jgi:hypothetical protein
MNALKNGLDGAKSLSCESLENQSNDSNVEELEPTLSTGTNKFNNISGNFILYANVAVIT